jgi:hypothetical protein
MTETIGRLFFHLPLPFQTPDSSLLLLCPRQTPSAQRLKLLHCSEREQIVTVDSHGGTLITVTGPCPGGLDTRDPVRDTEWQDRWLARDWLVTSSLWNRDEDYDTVVKSEKGSYDLVG